MNYLFTNVLAKVAGLTDWHQQPCPFVGLAAAGGSSSRGLRTCDAAGMLIAPR